MKKYFPLLAAFLVPLADFADGVNLLDAMADELPPNYTIRPTPARRKSRKKVSNPASDEKERTVLKEVPAEVKSAPVAEEAKPIEVAEEKPVEKPVIVEKVVEKPVIVEKAVEKIVEKRVVIEKPVTNTIEKVVEKKVVVEKPVEKKVIVEREVTNTIEKVVEKKVVVEKPVEKIVEKKVVVEKPVEKIVEKRVIVERPVEVEKRIIVEKPVTNTVEKVIEKKVVVEKPIEKIVEKRVIVEKPVTNTVEKVVEKLVYDRAAENRLMDEKQALQAREAALKEEKLELEWNNERLRKELDEERQNARRLARVAPTNSVPKKLTGRPAKITSETTYYDRKNGVAYFDRKVHVDDEQYQLHADRVYVFMSTTNDIRRIVAIGNVAMTNELKRAYGAKASYYRQSGMVVLYSGKDIRAEVRDESKAEDQVVRGDKIKFWLGSQQVEVSGADITAPMEGGGGGMPAMLK